MKDQDYILKKYVRAKTAEDALALDLETKVSEVFLAQDKPEVSLLPAVGFAIVRPEE